MDRWQQPVRRVLQRADRRGAGVSGGAVSQAEIQTDMANPVTPNPNAPKLVITAPAEGSTTTGGAVDIAYTTTGDLTGVDHVHFQVDNDPVKMDLSLDGTYALSGVHVGSHTLNGWLVRADHSKIARHRRGARPLLERRRPGRPDAAHRRDHGRRRTARPSSGTVAVDGRRRGQRRCLRRAVQARRGAARRRGPRRPVHRHWNTTPGRQRLSRADGGRQGRGRATRRPRLR